MLHLVWLHVLQFFPHFHHFHNLEEALLGEQLSSIVVACAICISRKYTCGFLLLTLKSCYQLWQAGHPTASDTLCTVLSLTTDLFSQTSFRHSGMIFFFKLLMLCTSDMCKNNALMHLQWHLNSNQISNADFLASHHHLMNLQLFTVRRSIFWTVLAATGPCLLVIRW